MAPSFSDTRKKALKAGSGANEFEVIGLTEVVEGLYSWWSLFSMKKKAKTSANSSRDVPEI